MYIVHCIVYSVHNQLYKKAVEFSVRAFLFVTVKDNLIVSLKQFCVYSACVISKAPQKKLFIFPTLYISRKKIHTIITHKVIFKIKWWCWFFFAFLFFLGNCCVDVIYGINETLQGILIIITEKQLCNVYVLHTSTYILTYIT